MTDLSRATGDAGVDGFDSLNGEPVRICTDENWSQRWAQTFDECAICGQPVLRRAAVKHWIHGATQLRYSHLTEPHLARPSSLGSISD